jgi:predicted Zn-dependent protease
LIYTAAGQTAKAAALAVELSGRFEADPRAYAEAVRAEIRLKNGEAVQAAVQLQAAAGVADAWLVRFALGRAYLAAGKPAEAHSEFERCLQRKGEAMALFLDDLPTFRYYPPVHYFLGRVEETLNNSGASGSFRAFLGFRKSAEDPLVEDARRRSQ